MIQDFENFRKMQTIGNKTQWEKKYDDGQTAWLVIDNRRVTRKVIRDSFSEKEYYDSVKQYDHKG